jgi:hypothetical protein
MGTFFGVREVAASVMTLLLITGSDGLPWTWGLVLCVPASSGSESRGSGTHAGEEAFDGSRLRLPFPQPISGEAFPAWTALVQEARLTLPVMAPSIIWRSLGGCAPNWTAVYRVGQFCSVRPPSSR